MDIRYSKVMKWFWHNHRENFDRLLESLSPNQLECKHWLIDELNPVWFRDHSLKIEIIGSWFAWPLVDFLARKFDIERIRLYDPDPFACMVARRYIEEFKFPFEIQTFEMSYWDHEQDEVGCHLLINTSAEHMYETLATGRQKYAKAPVVALQSNNMFNEEDHVNCVSSAESLSKQNGLKSILYSGTKSFDRYDRYMVIGV